MHKPAAAGVRLLIGLSLAAALLFRTGALAAPFPAEAKFSQSAGAVDTYDFVEVTLKLKRPGALNPFTDAELGGEFSMEGEAPLRVDGFCDADVGSVYRHFRNDAWAEQMGSFIKECDPYDHLTSAHGHGDFRFGASKWADFAM